LAILVQRAMMRVVEVFAVDAEFKLGAVFVVGGVNFRAIRASLVVIAGLGRVIKFLAVSAFKRSRNVWSSFDTVISNIELGVGLWI